MIPAVLVATFGSVRLLLGLLAAFLAHQPGSPQDPGCFVRPSRCGYPDKTNTGVPPGTQLRRSGSLTVNRDGATLDGLHVSGTVTVDADDVTIRNSLIVAPTGGGGSSAVNLERGADDFTIARSEIGGPKSRTDGLESAVWNHYGNPGARVIRSYFHDCADCWEGPGAFSNDFFLANGAYRGSHNENIYVCGGAVRVHHSTMINPHRQTATAFGDTAGCGGNTFVVTDNLLAGGGFVLYPQAAASEPVGRTMIAGNRFARCLTRPTYDKATGGTECQGGRDRHGIYPYGGYFGVAAGYVPGKEQSWARSNVWDDNLRPVCHGAGC